jgi:hypothetical protein
MKHFTVIHVSSLLSTATPGPLLRLVWLQDRGVCKFVGLLKDLANIATQVLSYLIPKNPCQPLVTTFASTFNTEIPYLPVINTKIKFVKLLSN